jgi:hypothetical protein
MNGNLGDFLGAWLPSNPFLRHGGNPTLGRRVHSIGSAINSLIHSQERWELGKSISLYSASISFPVPYFVGYVLCLMVLGSLSLAVIMQEIKFNDMSPVTHKMLRILMNKSILYAGMTLTCGFSLEQAFLGLGQVMLFLLVYVSQFLTNRRMENQIQNSYSTGVHFYFKYMTFSCITCASGLLAALHLLSTMGVNAFSFVCALDACTLLMLSCRGILVYLVRGLSVLFNLTLSRRGSLPAKRKLLMRKPTAEVAFYTEINGLVDAILEITMYSTSLLEYFALYMFRDGVFIHIFDLAVLLDIRYLISHSKRRMQRYTMLHQRAQFVTYELKREIAHSEDCAICMEGLAVGRRLRCGHVFHLKCLLGWIKECDGSGCTCPLCRFELMKSVDVYSPEKDVSSAVVLDLDDDVTLEDVIDDPSCWFVSSR